MANSTVLTNLQLQIQDDLNVGQTPLNRIIPQFVFPSSNAAIYSGYQFLQPTGGFPFTIFNSIFPFAAVVYVRNAGNQGEVLVTTITNGQANNSHVLAPTGFFLYCSPIDPNNGDVGIKGLTIENDTSASILFEYLYAY